MYGSGIPNHFKPKFKTMIEEWKDIPSYPGMYEVSNLGRVRRNGKILKPIKDRYGYLLVNLYKNGIVRKFLVHRLVALAFLPNPQNLPQVNHKDENKTNNCLDNLEWCDSKYNNNYGTRLKKVSLSLSKPILQFSKTGEFIREYESGVEAERITGIYQESISMCCSGNRSSAGGFVWKYK